MGLGLFAIDDHVVMDFQRLDRADLAIVQPHSGDAIVPVIDEQVLNDAEFAALGINQRTTADVLGRILKLVVFERVEFVKACVSTQD